MDLWLWHWNERPILPKGGSNVPKAQNSSPSSIEYQSDADSFLDAWESCSPRVPSSRLHGQPDFLQWSAETSEERRPMQKVRTVEKWQLIFPSRQRSSPLRTREFLAKHSISVLPPLSRPCSLWLFLFPKLKTTLKVRRFDIISEVKANATKGLKAITKETYQNCFKKWKHRWNKLRRVWEESSLKGDLSPRIYWTDLVLQTDVNFVTRYEFVNFTIVFDMSRT